MALEMQLPPNIPPEAIHAVVMLGRYFLAGCVILGIVPPVIRLFGRRFDRSYAVASLASADTTARLDRIEQGVEAIAIEVERIAEAQRFSARLAADQAARSLPSSSSRT